MKDLPYPVKLCGAERDRTDDLRLAKPALSQLSYSPDNVVGQGRLELPTSRLSGVRSNHLSYWPVFPGAFLLRNRSRRSVVLAVRKYGCGNLPSLRVARDGNRPGKTWDHVPCCSLIASDRSRGRWEPRIVALRPEGVRCRRRVNASRASLPGN